MDKKAELKLKYKQMQIPMGVYQIRNNANSKVFVGSTANLNGKINSARFQLNLGSHMNRELQKDWNEYGEGSFSFEILEVLKPQEDAPLNYSYSDELKKLEENWLEKLQPYGDKGYNKKKPE